MTHFTKKLIGVEIDLKANIYFDGKVVSHSIHEPNGTKKTLGLIYPGAYSFDTGAPELMVITSGTCQVRLLGEKDWTVYEAGNEFHVPGKSSFEISVKDGITEYLRVFK